MQPPKYFDMDKIMIQQKHTEDPWASEPKVVVDGVVWQRFAGHESWKCEMPDLGVLEIIDRDETVGHRSPPYLRIEICKFLADQMPEKNIADKYTPKSHISASLDFDDAGTAKKYNGEEGKFRFAVAKAKRLVREALGGRSGGSLKSVEAGDAIAVHAPYGWCPSKQIVDRLTPKGVVVCQTKQKFKPDGSEISSYPRTSIAEPWTDEHELMDMRDQLSVDLKYILEIVSRIEPESILDMRNAIGELRKGIDGNRLLP